MKELVVPLGLLAVMGSMLLPLPPAALDFLLVGNLVIALILFVSSLYISDSLKLSSLPSLLLIATLYRLGLNVATTRAILSGGDAGQVVLAFGHTVVAGNLIVGVVVFLVLTLIQFVVIAKGAERVAEVAARFTLDALPGKQMSIDADVRAGLIDFETARLRRDDLQTESRFFGALDGAMKFVKGDAIAGLCLVAVNLLGGFLVGMMGEGLSLSHAIQQYSLLTIGDGLVSQIPALLNALAAGMVVTRVARGDNVSLAQEVLQQLGQVRAVKVMIALFTLGAGLLPGMPALPFISLSIILLLAATVWHQTERPRAKRSAKNFEPRVPPVLLIEIGEEVRTQLATVSEFSGKMLAFREEVHREFGLVVALPELEVAQLDPRRYRISLRGIPVSDGSAGSSGSETLARIFGALKDIVADRMVEIIDDILTRRLLDCLEKEAPELVAAVVPTVVTVTQLTELLRGLAREGVPLKNFDVIVQVVAESGSRASSERVLLEEARIALRRVISHQYASPERGIPALVLDPVLDLSIARAERENEPLPVETIEHISQQIRSQPSDSRVLATSRASRRILSECLKLKGLAIPVIAYEEVAPGYEVEVRGRIELPAETSDALERDLLLGTTGGARGRVAA
jgi:type III secretion protein V